MATRTQGWGPAPPARSLTSAMAVCAREAVAAPGSPDAEPHAHWPRPWRAGPGRGRGGPGCVVGTRGGEGSPVRAAGPGSVTVPGYAGLEPGCEWRRWPLRVLVLIVTPVRGPVDPPVAYGREEAFLMLPWMLRVGSGRQGPPPWEFRRAGRCARGQPGLRTVVSPGGDSRALLSKMHRRVLMQLEGLRSWEVSRA